VGCYFILPPPKPRRGWRALSDDRSLINGILYVFTTGFRCVKCLGSMDHSNCWRRLRRLQEAGVWDKIVEFLTSMRSCRRVVIDSTTVEAKGG
jgi:transposase